jgi:hypothetical protein
LLIIPITITNESYNICGILAIRSAKIISQGESDEEKFF